MQTQSVQLQSLLQHPAHDVSVPKPSRETLQRLRTYPVCETTFVGHFVEILDPGEAIRRTLYAQAHEDVQLADELHTFDRDENAKPMREAFDALAQRTMARPGIIEYINDALVTAIRAQSLTSARWVLEQARVVYEKCAQIAPVRNAQGLLVVGEFNPVPALRALELIGKHVDVQAFKEVVEVTTSEDLAEVLNQARRRVEQRVIEGESTRLDDADRVQVQDSRGKNAVELPTFSKPKADPTQGYPQHDSVEDLLGE
jgi:phage terminase small subunit